MTLLSRPYADEADYARMRSLLVAHVGHGDAHYCTVGDLDWWNAQRGAAAPGAVRDARLWFAPDDQLLAFAWPGEGEADFVAHPDHPAIFGELLTWAEEDWRARAAAPAPPTFTTYPFDGDVERIAHLRARGYRPLDRGYRYRRQPLGGTLPAPPLAASYTIRSLAGEADLERRVAVHRAAFAPSRMTVEKHRAVMASPTYRRELDLFVVAPDDSFAAYCLVWFDTANRVGVFEPVGTHPDHRQRGLGKAVLAEGLRRLRALGATAAFVASTLGNVASNALYEAVGFRAVGDIHAWTRTL